MSTTAHTTTQCPKCGGFDFHGTDCPEVRTYIKRPLKMSKIPWKPIQFRNIKKGQYFFLNDFGTGWVLDGTKGRVPTRLWDAQYYTLDPDYPVSRCTREQAIEMTKNYRRSIS